MRSRLVVLLVLAAALSLVAPAAALAAPAAPKVTFNEKFTFTDQTFITTTITDGVIRAGSKTTGNGSTFTNCDYFTAQDAFLGGFQSAGFASNDPLLVQSFCLLHFADRAV